MVTHYAFRLLSHDVQLAVVYRDGTYLARRWEEEQGVNLYHLPAGFFAEVYYNPESNEVERVRSFSSARPITRMAWRQGWDSA